MGSEVKDSAEELLRKTKFYFAPLIKNKDLQVAALCDPRISFLDSMLSNGEWKKIALHMTFEVSGRYYLTFPVELISISKLV